MHVVLDALVTIKNVIFAFLRSWIQFFISPPQKSVAGETVLVTGAGSGLGQAIAVEFSKLGAKVVIWDISSQGLADTNAKIKHIDGICHPYICDVSSPQHVQEVAERVRSEVGEVTMLVNNAGVVVGKKLLELTDEEIERTFAVNLLAHIWTTKQFLPSMLENNHGHIINMGSSCGLIGIRGLTDYSASKFGVVGFTQTLNYEIHFSGHDGVHTTLVNPSHVTTGMFAGCKMPYPSLLSDLQLEPTVERIMQAVLTNQYELYIPRLVYIMTALKAMMPVDGMLEIIRFFRAEKFMDDFVGREKEKMSLVEKEE